MLTKCHQILMKTYRAIFSISKSQFKTWYIKFVISPEGLVIWCCQKKTTLLRWRQRTVKYLIFQVLSDAKRSRTWSERWTLNSLHCIKDEIFHFKDFFSKCDHIRRNLRILSHLLKKSLRESLIFCAVLASVLRNPLFYRKWA